MSAVKCVSLYLQEREFADVKDLNEITENV